jgi:hypothetical protein
MNAQPQGRTRRLRMLAFCLLAAGLASASPAFSQQRRDLTVERIYGGPSLSGQQLRDLRWSPD